MAPVDPFRNRTVASTSSCSGPWTARTSSGRLSAHRLRVLMKWPPSPAKRDPSSSSWRYQLSASSRPALTRYRVIEPPMTARTATSAGRGRGAKRRLNPTMRRSLPVFSTTSRTRSSSARVSASGFSTKTALTGLKGTAHQIRMGVMPRHDEDRVQIHRPPGRHPRWSTRYRNRSGAGRWRPTVTCWWRRAFSRTSAIRARCGSSIEEA